MRINERASTLIDRAGQTQVQSASKPEATKKATGAAGRPPGVEVNVSARAQVLAAGAAQVEELRAQVRAGTFKIDHQKIAALLLGAEDDE